jgi:hypothetical protein
MGGAQSSPAINLGSAQNPGPPINALLANGTPQILRDVGFDNTTFVTGYLFSIEQVRNLGGVTRFYNIFRGKRITVSVYAEGTWNNNVFFHLSTFTGEMTADAWSRVFLAGLPYHGKGRIIIGRNGVGLTAQDFYDLVNSRFLTGSQISTGVNHTNTVFGPDQTEELPI